MPAHEAKKLGTARPPDRRAPACHRRAVNRLRGTLSRCQAANIDAQHLLDRVHTEIDFMEEALRRG